MTRLPLARVTILIFLLALLSSGGTAQAVAQAGETGLVIAGVESQAFPRVAVFVAATGDQGPVEGLTEADFQIIEEGTAEPAETLEVEASRLPNLRLVLGLDVSGSPADLAGAQQAANGLIDSLGPEDRVAVMSFGDNVRLVRDFTNNTDELRAAVNGLAPIGSLTALNQALVEAITLVEQVPMGRRGVVLIANRLDNTEAPRSVADSLRQTQASRTPIHIIGFGENVPAAPPVEAQLTLTGGRYARVPNAAAIGSSLEETVNLIRQGYRVTFLSRLKADNAEHDFSISLAGQAAPVEGQFQAIPGALGVAVSGLVPGQTAVGLLTLIPQVTAPAPLASVEYLLDGQSLATVTESPYSFEWDSATVEPGEHTLTVQATDSAGNTGQTELDFSVAVPVQVSLNTPQSEVRIGDAIPLQADIKATSELVRVDFLLDGVVVDSKTEPPYQFDLDSSRYTPGEHTITLRVQDGLGYVGEDSLSLQFLPKPLPQPTWYERFVNNFWVRLGTIIILALLAVAALILVALTLLRLIRRAHHRLAWRYCRMEILNWGNIASHYRLQARDTMGGLSFQFMLNGNRLPLYAPPAPVGVTATATGRMPRSPVTPATAPAPATERGTAQGFTAGSYQQGRTHQTLNKAGEIQSQTQGCASTISDILESLAFLLPGPAGSFLRRISQQVNRGQYAVDQAIRTPTQMVRTADHVRYQVGQAIPSGSKEETSFSPAQPESGPVETIPETVVVESRPLQPEVPRQGLRRNSSPGTGEMWAETPLVEPEASLMIDLLIIPANPYQRQSYPFTLLSKPVEQEQAPLASEQGVLDLPGISWFWRYIPSFLVMLVTLILLLGVVWLTIWRLNEAGLLNIRS